VAADSELTDSLDTKQAYFKASRYASSGGLSKRRCVLIARSHTLLKDDVSALALYERAQTYISKTPSSLPSITDDIPVTKEDISSLVKVLESEMTRSHAQVILSNPTQTDSAQKVSPLSFFFRRLTIETVVEQITSVSAIYVH